MSTRRFNWRRARFEQTVGTMSILYIFTGTVFDAIVFCIKRSLMTMTIRKTRRYLNIYMLWLSTIFNIILPIVSLALLNTFITRWTFSSSFHAWWWPCNTSAYCKRFLTSVSHTRMKNMQTSDVPLVFVIFSPQMYFLGLIFLHMKARKLWQNLPKFLHMTIVSPQM